MNNFKKVAFPVILNIFLQLQLSLFRDSLVIVRKKNIATTSQTDGQGEYIYMHPVHVGGNTKLLLRCFRHIQLGPKVHRKKVILFSKSGSHQVQNKNCSLGIICFLFTVFKSYLYALTIMLKHQSLSANYTDIASCQHAQHQQNCLDPIHLSCNPDSFLIIIPCT